MIKEGSIRRPRREGAYRPQRGSAHSLAVEGGGAGAHGQPIQYGHDQASRECRPEECRAPQQEQLQDSPLSGNA